MAKAKRMYLVVHPKLNKVGKKGIEELKRGSEISLDEATAKRLIATGKVKLVTNKKEDAEAEAAALAEAEAAELAAAEAAAKAAETQE